MLFHLKSQKLSMTLSEDLCIQNMLRTILRSSGTLLINYFDPTNVYQYYSLISILLHLFFSPKETSHFGLHDPHILIISLEIL